MVPARETTLQELMEGSKQYQAPLYQRTYSWQSAAATPVGDILQLASDRADSPTLTHFIGSLVLAPSPANGPSRKSSSGVTGPGCGRRSGSRKMFPTPCGGCASAQFLRSGFGPLYAAYGAIFSAFSADERAWLFHRTAERWYATATDA